MTHTHRFLRLFALTLFVSVTTVAGAEDPADWAQQHVDEFIPLYEYFHRNPELSFFERETSRRLAGELDELGIDVTTGVGGFGVVGMLRNGPGKLLLLRSDLDALPVTEETGLDYASDVRVSNPTGTGEVGVMHACGHDVHITNLIGVAKFLSTHRDQWRGTVMFVGQPAEERVAGARAMLEDGLYEKFGKPDYALALHVSPIVPAGRVAYRGGFALANVDSADITVRGIGGHGAQPHTTVDPIVQAAQLVLALQTIVSREITPIQPAVVTVGSIRGGSKHNIIADECHLQLTIRTYSQQVRKQILEAIERKARGIALAAGAPEPEVKISEGTNAVFNDLDLVERVVPVLGKALGDGNVIEGPQSMGAEDFGMFAQDGVPIMMIALGSITAERLKELGRPLSLHSSIYYPDIRPTLVAGMTAMSAAALDLLSREP